MNYNDKNHHHRDEHIVFHPDSHQYFFNGMEFDSVTTVIESMFEKFDAEYWSLRKAGSKEGAARLREQWEEKARQARDLGTLMHERIENHFLGNQSDPDCEQDPCFILFLRFCKRFPLTPYRTEWRIYHEEARIAGTLDFLAFDGSEFEIYDWKRSGKLIDEFGRPMQSNPYGKTGLGIMGHIPDSSLYHYALQLSLYRYILRTKYGIDTARAYLGVFYPTYDRPYRISVPYLAREVESLITYRCQ